MPSGRPNGHCSRIARKKSVAWDDGTLFAETVARLGLADHPEQWPASAELKRFARRFHNTRYVPESLLKQWGWVAEDAA